MRVVGLCEFALDNAAIGDADPVASARQHAHEMHETLPAYAFEALKLGKRIGVIVDTQVEIRPFFFAANDERGGLLAAFVAARGLAGSHRSDQAARKGQRGIFCIGGRRILDDARAREHVAGNRKIVAGQVPAPIDAALSGMGGDAALRVDHMDLAVVAARIRGDDRGDNLFRAGALFQEAQAVGAVKNIDQCLGRDRADARFEMRRQRTNGKEARGNRNPELPGILIARDDRPGHAGPSLLARSKSSAWRSLGDSNPCFRRERATSWAARRRERPIRNSRDGAAAQASACARCASDPVRDRTAARSRQIRYSWKIVFKARG